MVIRPATVTIKDLSLIGRRLIRTIVAFFDFDRQNVTLLHIWSRSFSRSYADALRSMY